MSMKSFLMRKMLASKMKGVPQAEQDKIFTMLEKNPEFFQKIGLEIQEEMKRGVDQMIATQNIVKKYQTELKGLM
ncbi:hypothetical protein K2P96_00495 [Patescibacteria group bacterium]|nr:hypothetical protein [Patescibacteria group bacterium]